MFVLLLICIVPVGAYIAYDDWMDVYNCYPFASGRVNVMANDVNDADDPSLIKFEITEYPKHGFASLGNTGWLGYIANDYFEVDSLKYLLCRKPSP